MEKTLIGVDTSYGPSFGYEVKLTWKLPKKVRAIHPLTENRNTAGGLNPMTDIEVEVIPVPSNEEGMRIAAEWRNRLVLST